ncbi:MAG TPA: c-type cytochrome [Gaiellaceae bacterium]|jgi:mono/diheme cytochrome c family protein|nr:c-type cytochrome [Gaiellaceae bacterium]
MSGDLARKLALLAALLLALGAVALAGCGGDDEAAEEPPAATTDEGTTTEEETTTEADGGTEGDAEAGAQLFADNGCGNCHTLEAAGTTGTTGPNLDEVQPSFDAAVEQITNGGGVMPAFGESLSDQQIRDLAAYVVESSGG